MQSDDWGTCSVIVKLRTRSCRVNCSESWFPILAVLPTEQVPCLADGTMISKSHFALLKRRLTCFLSVIITAHNLPYVSADKTRCVARKKKERKGGEGEERTRFLLEICSLIIIIYPGIKTITNDPASRYELASDCILPGHDDAMLQNSKSLFFLFPIASRRHLAKPTLSTMPVLAAA